MEPKDRFPLKLVVVLTAVCYSQEFHTEEKTLLEQLVPRRQRFAA